MANVKKPKKSSRVINYYRETAREQKTLEIFVKPSSHIGTWKTMLFACLVFYC